VSSIISLREASRKVNGSNLFTKKQCNCTSKCVSKRCSCKANGILCSTHCHSSRPCCNKGAQETASTNSQLTAVDIRALNGNGWLNDRHMTYGSSLLKGLFPDVEGLNDTVLQQSTTAVVTARAQKYVQIFHVNGNHWITASNIMADTSDVVDIYDSARVRLCSIDKAAIARFHRCCNATLTLRYRDVQRQPNSSDCGVYALAFATSLLHGQDPTEVKYVAPRSHLAMCLTSGQMSPFPDEPRDVAASTPATESLPLYCVCRSVDDGRIMIACDGCDGWFHKVCVLGDDVDLPAGSWICEDCRQR